MKELARLEKTRRHHLESKRERKRDECPSYRDKGQSESRFQESRPEVHPESRSEAVKFQGRGGTNI